MLGDEYTISVEGYYKDYDHLLDLNELGGEGGEDDFLRGYGRAAGAEILLRKQKGSITGWLGYALTFTDRTIELPRSSYFLGNLDIKKEYQTYPPSYDRRHTLTLVANVQPGGKWKLSTRFTYASGLPETPTVGWKRLYSLEDDPNEVTGDVAPLKAPKNSRRYPAYIRWDISATRTYRFKNWSLQPFLQIINLTNHKNIFIYNYDLEREFDGEGNLLPAKREGIPMFPLVPTIGVSFKF